MKKVLEFMISHGYWFMGVGMALALTGVFIMMEPRHRMGTLRVVGISIGIAGFALYFVGRVCVALERRRPRGTGSESDT